MRFRASWRVRTGLGCPIPPGPGRRAPGSTMCLAAGSGRNIPAFFQMLVFFSMHAIRVPRRGLRYFEPAQRQGAPSRPCAGLYVPSAHAAGDARLTHFGIAVVDPHPLQILEFPSATLPREVFVCTDVVERSRCCSAWRALSPGPVNVADRCDNSLPYIQMSIDETTAATSIESADCV